MELARLRTEYHAAANAALRVAVAALLAFGVAFVLVDGRRTALRLFLVAAFAGLVGFATYFAVHRALARGRSRLVTVASPTLATRTAVLQLENCRPPLHASREADAETRRRHVSIAVPGAVGFCSAYRFRIRSRLGERWHGPLDHRTERPGYCVWSSHGADPHTLGQRKMGYELGESNGTRIVAGHRITADSSGGAPVRGGQRRVTSWRSVAARAP